MAPAFGKVVPTENGYTVDGVQVPRVTTISNLADKPYLVQAAVNIAAKVISEIELEPLDEHRSVVHNIDLQDAAERAKTAYRMEWDEARDIGQILHAYAESRLNGAGPGHNHAVPEVKNVLDAFDSWMAAQNPEALAVEATVGANSTSGPYAGRIDAVVKMSGGVFLVDFKTDKSFYDSTVLQLGAYAHALKEDGLQLDGAYYVRFDKAAGEWEQKLYTTDVLEMAWQRFEALLKYWWLSHPKGAGAGRGRK